MESTIIGKYKIIRLIGEGGMASVYEAAHTILGIKVAIKILNPILSNNWQIKERFRNEAKLMASLDHPNIAKVIDFDEQPHRLSIVMEFLDGLDLNEKIKRNGPLNDYEVIGVFAQTLAAFQYAHEKGIIHRDVSPSNIFILPNGQVKILDFGVAKIFGQDVGVTQTGIQMGTPIYMSPEQVKSDKYIDHRSDIYSLGVTMYFAINGKTPFNSSETIFNIYTKIVNEPLPNFIKKTKLNDVVLKACSKNQDERFQNCFDFAKELQFPSDLAKKSLWGPYAKEIAQIGKKFIGGNKSVENVLSNNQRPTWVQNKKQLSIVLLGIISLIVFIYSLSSSLLKAYESTFNSTDENLPVINFPKPILPKISESDIKKTQKNNNKPTKKRKEKYTNEKKFIGNNSIRDNDKTKDKKVSERDVKKKDNDKKREGDKPRFDKVKSEKKPTNNKSYPLDEYDNFTGKHKLSLQWISWDYFGYVDFVKKGDNIYAISGFQDGRKSHGECNNCYLKIKGFVRKISEKEFIFDGRIESSVESNQNGEPCIKEGRFKFKSAQGKTYWRLQDMDGCDGEANYVDIYYRY